MILAIVGPTGVGKTKLSIELAKKYNAIIISADATQVYKELNIGSAKVLEEEKEGIKHYLIDIVKPSDEYNVYDYQNDARKIIADNKDKNIIFVGGSGLYLKAALYNYEFKKQDEVKPVYDVTYIGLTTNRDILYNRIDKRVDIMLSKGLLDEVKHLYQKYPDSKILHSAIGYKELIMYLNNELSYEDAIELIKKNSRHYAKRQYTFFNNQFNINWFDTNFDNFNETVEEIVSFIEKN